MVPLHRARAPAAAVVIATLAACGLACSGRRGRVDIPTPEPTAPILTDPSVSADDAGAPAGGAEEPKGEVVVAPMTPPPPPERMPKLSFVSPKQGEAIPVDKADAFEIRVDVKDWFIEPGDHVHLVLDNKPYKALEEPKAIIKLGDVFPGEPPAEGGHVLAAFPARASHLTIKPERGRAARPGSTPAEAGPFAVVSFWVGKAGKTLAYKPGDPLLFYSRPKGTYNGKDGDDVLLDFYLANLDLGEGRGSVRATVSPPGRDPVQLTIKRWTPFSISNLPSGSTKVLLELCDKDDRPMPGLFARVEREISVNRDAR